VLNGNNTYNGGTTISGGTLRFGATATVPAGQITITTPGVLQGSGPTNFASAAQWLQSGRISTASTGSLALTSTDTGNIDATWLQFTLSFDAWASWHSYGDWHHHAAKRLPAWRRRHPGGHLQPHRSPRLGCRWSGRLILSGTIAIRGPLRCPMVGRCGSAALPALGSAQGGTVVQSGGRLELSGNITVTGETLTLNGNGGDNLGALTNTSGNNTWASPILSGAPVPAWARPGEFSHHRRH
jgi:hypothetical protein